MLLMDKEQILTKIQDCGIVAGGAARGGAAVGALQGVRPLGGPLAPIRTFAGAGRRRAVPALHAGGKRADAPAGRHIRDALLCRPDHRLGVAVHDAAHGRPALHGHAGRRGARTPGRQPARRARRPRTAQLRHPLTRGGTGTKTHEN